MRVLVMGSGAIGCYFGGMLARAGAEVTFVARGPQLAALQARGLAVQSFRGDFALPVRTVADPAAAGQADVVLFCVKAYDTEAAAAALRPALGPESVVLSLQNGVDNEAKIAGLVGAARVLGGVAYLFSEVVEPGLIRHTAGGRIVFGEPDGATSARAARLAALLERGGVPAEIASDITKVKWTKLVFNAALNALTALTRCDLARILACPETRATFVEALAEVEAVARKEGVELDADVIARTLGFAESLGPAGSSMLQDVERGRRLEVEALNGVVVRLGERAGVPVPVNRLLYHCLKVIDQARASDARMPEIVDRSQDIPAGMEKGRSVNANL